MPGFIIAIIAVALVGVAITLVDLSRREVRHLPKWGWALVIVLVSFPIGAILYMTIGRISPHEVILPPET